MRAQRFKPTPATKLFAAIGFVVALLIAIGLDGSWVSSLLFPPGPMAYCEVLVTRRLVDDCAEDPTRPAGGRSVTFTVRSASQVASPSAPEANLLNAAIAPTPKSDGGRKGRITVLGSADAYWSYQKQQGWSDFDFLNQKQAGKRLEAYLYGSQEARLILYVPAPLDEVDTEGFGHFLTVDTRQILHRQAVAWWPTREHPVHTEACVHSPGCPSEGKCASYPRDPENCIAGFDEDCVASTLCIASNRCYATSEGAGCY